jgi:hypothetical protein
LTGQYSYLLKGEIKICLLRTKIFSLYQPMETDPRFSAEFSIKIPE